MWLISRCFKVVRQAMEVGEVDGVMNRGAAPLRDQPEIVSMIRSKWGERKGVGRRRESKV